MPPASHCQTTLIECSAPRYITGHAINIGTVGAAIVCIVVLLFYNVCDVSPARSSPLTLHQRSENRKRASGKRDNRLQEESAHRLGSRHPNVGHPRRDQTVLLTIDTVPAYSVRSRCRKIQLRFVPSPSSIPAFRSLTQLANDSVKDPS